MRLCFLYKDVHGLCIRKCWMLFSDVILYAGGRLEGHGAAGAFVEQITMSLLDVRLHGVESSEHHEATGTSVKAKDKGMSGDVTLM